MISTHANRTIRVWDLWKDDVAILKDHTGGVSACAVTPDGRRMVSSSGDGTLKVWDLESNCVRAMANGRYAISESNDWTLTAWDLESWCIHASLNDYLDWTLRRGFAMTADGRRVVLASDGGSLMVWDLERGTLHAWDLENGQLMPIEPPEKVSPVRSDEEVEATGARHFDVISDVSRKEVRRSTCAVSAGGRRAVSVFDEGPLKVWDLETRQALATVEGHGRVRACAVTPDGRHMVSASEDRTLKVWDLKTYACLFTHRGDAAYTAVAATATAIVAGDANGAIWFLDWPQ